MIGAPPVKTIRAIAIGAVTFLKDALLRKPALDQGTLARHVLMIREVMVSTLNLRVPLQ